jgi:hypothetical protein
MTRYCPTCGAEYIDTVSQCADCLVPLQTQPGQATGASGPSLAETDHDILVYELDQWEPQRRTQVEAVLAGASVPFQWEGTDLLVPAAFEAKVDDLLDQVEFPDALPSDEELGEEDIDDEAVYQVMSDLFVIADRIADSKEVDLAVAGDFIIAAAAAAATGAPFGFDERTWQEVQRQAGRIAEQLENEEDDDVVISEARILRDALRGFV